MSFTHTTLPSGAFDCQSHGHVSILWEKSLWFQKCVSKTITLCFQELPSINDKIKWELTNDNIDILLFTLHVMCKLY